MNERLEAFRKRLIGPEKSKDAWKFWIGSPTAWLALLLSAGTAYYNVLRVHDDLRVIISDVTLDMKDEDTINGQINNTFTGTFINTGNRPISVLGASLTIGQLGDGNRGCDYWLPELKIPIKPFVVKANDVGVAPVATQGYGSDHFQRFENGQPVDTTVKNKALICIRFTTASPDGQFQSNYFPFIVIGENPETKETYWGRQDDENIPMRILTDAPEFRNAMRHAYDSVSSWMIMHDPFHYYSRRMIYKALGKTPGRVKEKANN